METISQGTVKGKRRDKQKRLGDNIKEIGGNLPEQGQLKRPKLNIPFGFGCHWWSMTSVQFSQHLPQLYQL